MQITFQFSVETGQQVSSTDIISAIQKALSNCNIFPTATLSLPFLSFETTNLLETVKTTTNEYTTSTTIAEQTLSHINISEIYSTTSETVYTTKITEMLSTTTASK